VTDQLGRLMYLPADYLQDLRAQNTLPLWPSIGVSLPARRSCGRLQRKLGIYQVLSSAVR
jgi:hypothetical protein